MSYDAKRWLRKVAKASVKGMADQEVAERGFDIMLAAMRAAYAARHPARPASSSEAVGRE